MFTIGCNSSQNSVRETVEWNHFFFYSPQPITFLDIVYNNPHVSVYRNGKFTIKENSPLLKQAVVYEFSKSSFKSIQTTLNNSKVLDRDLSKSHKGNSNSMLVIFAGLTNEKHFIYQNYNKKHLPLHNLIKLLSNSEIYNNSNEGS